MIIGQVLHGLPSTSGTVTTTYFSPWFPSAGNKIGVACDVIQSLGLAALRITVQTKFREQSDSSATAIVGGAETISLAGGIYKFTRGGNLGDDGAQELCRYKFDVEMTANQPGWVHLRMLNPTWLTN